MVYNLNESLGYSRGAETNKTSPQTTNYPTKTPIKEVSFRLTNHVISFITITALIINLTIISISCIINTLIVISITLFSLIIFIIIPLIIIIKLIILLKKYSSDNQTSIHHLV